jgi:hypothetical protein
MRIMRVWVAVGALATLATLPAHAQSTAGPISMSVYGASPQLPQLPPDRSAAWRLLAGYQFSQHFGFEAAYGDLARYGHAAGGLSALGDVRMRAWSLAGTGSLPLGKTWSLIGKVGVGSNVPDLGRVGSPLGTTTWGSSGLGGRSDTFLGLGLGYSVGRGFGLRFEYENYGALGGLGGNGAKGDQWAVSLKYSF